MFTFNVIVSGHFLEAVLLFMSKALDDLEL